MKTLEKTQNSISIRVSVKPTNTLKDKAVKEISKALKEISKGIFLF